MLTLQQTTRLRRTIRPHMRTPTRHSLKGIPLLLGTPTTATATTTRPRSPMYPQPTYLRPRLTAGRNLLQRRHLRLRNATSRHCIARNMRRLQRRPPSRQGTNRHTPQVILLNSTRGRHTPAMVSRPPRARMCPILHTRIFLSALTTHPTRIPSPTGCLGLVPSRRRCRPLQAVPRSLLRTLGIIR